MATTEHFYTGNNSTTDYSFTFPYLTTTDIKVELDNVATTEYTLPTSTTVRFNTAPGTGVSIHIYRDTDVDTAKAIYAAGSSVRAVDLNNNKDQDLYTLQELKGQLVKTSDIKDGAVTSAKIFDGTIVADDIANTTITGSKLVNDTITATQIAADAIGTSELADNSVASANIIDGAVVNADINASAAITYSKLEDVNSSKILVGNGSNKAAPVDMSGDITITNSGVTTIGADAVQIGNISDTETTLTANSDAKIPTSKAVADHVVDVVNSVGGFVIVADKDSFPTSNPDPNNDAGTVLSITNPNGLTVSGGTSSNGTRTGVSDTVSITGIPTDAGSTLTANYTMLVQTTSTAHTYTFYKFLAKDGDVLNLSNDINDFAARYRIASSAPGSDNDEGDLYFNTSTNKMYVYDGSDWGQVTSTGEFKDLTVVDQGQTSGSPTFNGSNVSFDLRDGSSAASITNRNQLLIVLNGVVQKSNAGTWSSSEEGFYLEGTDGIKFCTAPPSGSTIFATLLGSATDIPTPGDETVTEAKLNANAPTNDHVLTADSSATGGFKWAAASGGVGGATGVDFADGVKVRFGAPDMEIYGHSNNAGHIRNANGGIGISVDSSPYQVTLSAYNTTSSANNTCVSANSGSSTNVSLNYNGTQKLQTTADGISATGATFTGDVTWDNQSHAGNDITWDESDNALEFSDHVKCDFGNDLIIGHDLPGATDKSLIASTSDLEISVNKTIFKDGNSDPSLTIDCANDKIIIADHLEPEADSTHDLGTNSVRFRNAYLDDVNLTNLNGLAVPNGGTLSGRRNAFINGDLSCWQRGTTGSTSGAYVADRWWWSGGTQCDRSTEAPSGFTYSAKVTYGSSDISFGQPIELPVTGKQGKFISGQKITVSWYGKVDSTTEVANAYLRFRESKSSSSNEVAFTVVGSAAFTLTTSWQRFTQTWTIPTVGATNTLIAFELGDIGKDVYLTGFQFELGELASPYEFRSYQEELEDSKRYYQQLDNTLWVMKGAQGIDYGHACMQTSFILPTPMRATPVGQPIGGTGTITVRMWNNNYASANDVEMYVGEGSQNGTVSFQLCYNQDDNSSTALSSSYVMGETLDKIEFDAEL